MGLVVLESKVEVPRVLFHHPTVEPLVKLQLVDKSIIWPRLRSEPRQHLQHGRDRGTTSRVEEPGSNHRDTSTDSVSATVSIELPGPPSRGQTYLQCTNTPPPPSPRQPSMNWTASSKCDNRSEVSSSVISIQKLR